MESTLGIELSRLTLQNEKLEAAYKGIEEENTGLMEENKKLDLEVFEAKELADQRAKEDYVATNTEVEAGRVRIAELEGTKGEYSAEIGKLKDRLGQKEQQIIKLMSKNRKI